jgi:Peptidase family M23/EamA-like transporter family
MGALLPPSGAAPLPFNSTVGSVPASTQIPPVLSPPVEGGIWYMSEGCCNDDTHHRRGLAPINGQLAVPQRFAIDFFRLDAEHRTWVGDPSKVTSYLSYRQPVIAAAPGTVVASRNDLPNSTALPHPPPIPPIDQTVGNFVIEQIAPGAYILYAHLDPGSVQVHAGQKVSRGQLLGRIGTSGNSTTPHLHFQLLTGRAHLTGLEPARRDRPGIAERHRVGRARRLDLFQTTVGYLAFYAGLQQGVSSTAAAVLSLLEPVAATVLAILLLGQHLAILAGAGIVILLTAVLLVREPDAAARTTTAASTPDACMPAAGTAAKGRPINPGEATIRLAVGGAIGELGSDATARTAMARHRFAGSSQS